MKLTGRSRGPARDALERRYRRLFAWYPAAYRAESEDEMLGVALDGTRPGQRWPAPGEARSLVTGGIRTRLDFLLAGARGPAWRDASAAFTFLAAAPLAAVFMASLLTRLLPVAYWGTGWSIFGTGPGFTLHLVTVRTGPGAGAVMSAVIWPVVAVLAAMGRRWATAAGAVLGVAVRGMMIVGAFRTDPSSIVAGWWQFALAVTAALAAVTWLVASGDASRPAPGRLLPRRAVAAVAIVAVVVAARPAVESALLAVTGNGPGFDIFSPLFRLDGDLGFGLVLLMSGTLLAVTARLSLAVRRRVLLLFLPALAAAFLVHWTFGGYLSASSRFVLPPALTGSQWAALALMPALTLVLGVAWLHRHERMLRTRATQLTDGS